MNIDPLHRRLPARSAAGVAESGSATIFVVGFALVLFAGAGLAIDGGRAINMRDKATDVAEQAARVGAGQLDQEALRRDGKIVLNQDAARIQADTFVAESASSSPESGYAPTTTTTGDSVTVRVSATYRTALLGIVGISSIDVSGDATARPNTG